MFFFFSLGFELFLDDFGFIIGKKDKDTIQPLNNRKEDETRQKTNLLVRKRCEKWTKMIYNWSEFVKEKPKKVVLKKVI